MFEIKMKRYSFLWLIMLLLVTSVVCSSSAGISTPVPTDTEAASLPATETDPATAPPSPTVPPSATAETAPVDETTPPTSEESDTPTEAPPSPTSSPTVDIAAEAVRFAVIGDYGSGDQNEADVADLVKSWDPDLIITTGDNNYGNDN